MAKKNGDMSATIGVEASLSTENLEKQIESAINKKRTLLFDADVKNSSINASYRKIQEEFDKKNPIWFNVDVRKSSINKAFATLRDELANKKAITVNVVPKMDVSKADFAGKNSVDRIKNYIQSLLKDVEVKLTPKFDMRSITASIRNMKQELNKVAGTETDTKVNTLIIANHRGNIDSPEMLSSWIDQISRFNKVAQKIPHGLINVKVNLAANIDENFKQLLNGGLDLSKIKGGKLDINVHDDEGSSSGGRRKGGKGKSSGGNNLSELDDLPSLTSGDSSKLLNAFNKYFNNNSKLQIKTLEDAIDKATGINFKSMGNNQDVHIQAALSKLAQEAQRYMYDNKLDEAKVLNDLANRLRTEYAKYNSEYANNGIYGPASKAQFNQLGLMSTSDYHKSLDSDRSAKIEEDNKRRAKYQKQLQADLEKGTSFLKNGSMDDVSTLLTHKLRDASNDDVKSRLELLKGYVDEFEKQTDTDKKHIREALKEWVDGEVKSMKNILDAMHVRSEDVNKSIRNATAQQLNTANEIAGLNSLSHGESLKEKAFQRANLDGDYDEAIRHYRDKNRQRLERLDPMQGKINDLLNERRGQSESERNSSNQRLVDLVNEKIRLMTDAKQSDFGLKDQIRYLESQLKKTGEDKGAYNSIKSLLDKANKDFNEGIQATYADRVKYFDQMAKEAFNKAKANATNGKDFTSDINDFLRYANLHTESQLANTKGQSADFSKYATSFQEMQKFGGIDPKLKGELADLEVEYRQLDKAMRAAGDTSKKLDNEFKALQDSVSKINSASGVNKLATDLEKVLNAKFSRGDSINKEIGALSQMATSLNSRGLDGEPIARLARRMKELSDEAKKVTQAEQQATKAQTTQNQAVIEAEKELEKLARDLDNVYRSSSKVQRANPFGGPVKEAADKYKQKLEEIYKLKRQIGQLRSDGDAARELLGRSTTSGNRDFHSAVNNRIQNIFENLAGKFGRQEAQSRDRAGRTSTSQNIVNWATYGAKFLGRSAKGTGSALEASAMGLSDGFKLMSSSVGMVGKSLGAAGIAISLFTGGLAAGIEVTTKLFSVFEQLISVVYRLLQPGIELYKQVTKATYSMGAAIASNAKFGEQQVSLATGIATSANLQRKAMLDAEVSVFDFNEIIQSLSGTLPILLGKGMSVEEAYQTNLGVASVAKLTNLAPNQVLQETRDLAQGSITARSSQVANALNITNEDIRGKSSDEIFKIFTDKFQNYKEVLNQYAETPVGAFEQMMDRLRTVSMKFVEEIAYPFKEMFNWLTDFTGSWVDSEKRKLTRVDMGDGTTEQFWLKGGIDTKNDGAKYSIKEAMDMLGGDLTKLTEAIDRATKGNATATDSAILSQFGLDSSSLVDKNSKDIIDSLFGNITKASGGAEFSFGPEFDKLKESFVDLFKYLGSALDEILTHIADTFGTDGATDFIDLFTEAIKWLIDTTKDAAEWTISLIKGLITFARMSESLIAILGGLIKIIWNCSEILYDMLNMAVNSIGYLFSLLASGINKLIGWITDKFGISYDTGGNQSRIDNNIEYFKKQYLAGFHGMAGDFEDIMGVFGYQKESKNKSTFFLDRIAKGIENMEKQNAKRDAKKGDAVDPNLLRGTPKNKVDEKALREARKAEKKAFDKYIAQLREALEKHIQELKDLKEKNEVYYKQGLTNYSDYITNKVNYDLDEQRSKKQELLDEREAIQNTGKYENEDDREKDLANNQKEIDKVDRSIGRLESVQSETSSILKRTNGVLSNLSDSIKMLSYGLRGSTKGGTSTSISTANLTADELLGMNIDMDSVDVKRNWAMDYIQSQGYSLQQAAGIMGNLLTESRTLDPYDTNGDHWGIVQWDRNRYDSVLKFAESIGTDINDAMQFFKAQVRFMVQELGSNPYNITPDSSIGYVEATKLINKEYEVSGEYSGKALQDRINRAEEALANYRANQMNTITTKKNVNLVDSILNGSDIDEAIKKFEGDLFVREHSGVDIEGLNTKTKQLLLVLSSWIKGKTGEGLTVTSAYRPGDGTGENSHGGRAKFDVWNSFLASNKDLLLEFLDYGASIGAGLTSEFYDQFPDISSGDYGRNHVDVSSGGKQFHNPRTGEVSNYGGFNPMANKDMVETLRQLGVASTEDALKTLEKSFDYILKPFELLASISKYTNPTYGSMEDLKANSAEYMKGWYKLQKDILTTTGVDDKQQAELRKYVQDLGNFQLQEVIANNLKKQLESQLEDAEALFDYDVASSASRLDFDAISDKYKSIFTNMDNGIGKTIETIQQAIKEADESGNKTVAKDLRQALNKFTSKLIEFFNKAEEAITKQYEYVETALNNIGATNLQKEGISRRFNLEKNRAFADMYRSKEANLTSIYKQLVNRGLKEAESNGGQATAETLKAIAEVEEALLKNHWALQQAEELGKFKTALEEANDVFKQSLEDGLVDFMTDGVNAVLEGTKTIGEAFRELAVSILKTMQQFFAKKLIENLMNKLYPMDDDIKRITDTANWQPKDLLKNPQGEQTYKAQMDNPVLKPYMKEGYIIKNVPSDTTYGPIREPEYEAINPADALAQQLQKTSNSLGQFDSALWKFIDEANGKTIYPDEDVSQTKAETSANNLSVAMDNAATATTNNATTTAVNTATTEVNSNANTQATTTIQQKDSTERLNISATENDTDALNRHASALSNDTAPQVQTEGVDSASDSGVDGGAGMQSPGSFKGNFLTSLMGSDFMQLAGGLFAVKTLFSGDTKEKLLSAIFIELQLMYVELIKLSSNLLTGLFGYASGGYISGPGTGTSDSIPAMLSNGEFVVKANAVKKYGTNFLNAVNDGTFATIKPRHHYASGGLVTETAREATSTVVTELGRGIGTNINNEAHFNLVMASNQEDAMRAFMRSPEGQRIYLDMARKYASTTVRF